MVVPIVPIVSNHVVMVHDSNQNSGRTVKVVLRSSVQSLQFFHFSYSDRICEHVRHQQCMWNGFSIPSVRTVEKCFFPIVFVSSQIYIPQVYIPQM